MGRRAGQKIRKIGRSSWSDGCVGKEGGSEDQKVRWVCVGREGGSADQQARRACGKEGVRRSEDQKDLNYIRLEAKGVVWKTEGAGRVVKIAQRLNEGVEKEGGSDDQMVQMARLGSGKRRRVRRLEVSHARSEGGVGKRAGQIRRLCGGCAWGERAGQRSVGSEGQKGCGEEEGFDDPEGSGAQDVQRGCEEKRG